MVNPGSERTDIGFRAGLIVKEEVRALQTGVKKIPVPGNGAPHIAGHMGKELFAEAVVGID
jgi:hypothetical protein